MKIVNLFKGYYTIVLISDKQAMLIYFYSDIENQPDDAFFKKTQKLVFLIKSARNIFTCGFLVLHKYIKNYCFVSEFQINQIIFINI